MMNWVISRFPKEPEDDGSGSNDGKDEGNEIPENLDPDAGKTQRQVIDEITGQLELFPDE